MSINFDTLDRIILTALSEDIGFGDITSFGLVSISKRFMGVITARESLVLAGLEIAHQVFAQLARALDWEALAIDGDELVEGSELARISGPAYQLLSAERTALNFLQHLSGIATLTRLYVKRIAGTGAVLLDTRKTIPGLRELAKYATLVGGAQNHRMRLDNGILIKDNHIALVGSLEEAISRARLFGFVNIEVECDSILQVHEALRAGASRLLLDNMDIETLRIAVSLAQGRALTEASGGINLSNIRDIAKTGVNYISVGRITQSAPAIDIGLDWFPFKMKQKA